jgi:hypothetical protein
MVRGIVLLRIGPYFSKIPLVKILGSGIEEQQILNKSMPK